MYFFIFFTLQSSPISQESSHSQKSDYIDSFIVTITDRNIFNRIAMFFLTFSQTFFFVIFQLLLLLQSATKSTLSFILRYLLSSETIFMFLCAPKADQSLCVPDAHQRCALAKTQLFNSYALARLKAPLIVYNSTLFRAV